MAIYDVNGNEIAIGGGSSAILSGLTVLALGDSITSYQGNDLFQYAKSLYGLTTGVNSAVAGATWKGGKAKVDTLIANADLATLLNEDYDIITFAYGTNNDTTNGTINDSISVDSMCGNAKYCIENTLYYCRKAKIGGIIPPQRADGNAGQKEKNELLRQIYQMYSIPYLDLERNGQIVPDNINSVATNLGKSQYYLGDGLHLGANGMKLYQYKYAHFIANL